LPSEQDVNLTLKHHKRWTKIEDAILKEKIKQNVAHADIAKFLHRSLDSVHNRVEKLNLGKPEQKWTAKEVQFLKQNYQTMKVREIAEALKCSKSRVANKARYMGLSKKITDDQRRQVLELSKKPFLTNEKVAQRTNMSVGSVCLILREAGVKRKLGAKSSNPLMKGYRHSGRGGDSKHRHHLLYAYHNTCWDCKRTFVNESDLQIHHDLTELPVKVLVLCKECHGKRHKRKFKMGTRNN
jgi:hypothetical protein